MLDYAVLLLATIAIEALVVRSLVAGLLRRRALVTCVFLNLLTHPLAFLILAEPRLAGGLLLVEVLVVLGESIGYRAVAGLPAGRALGLGLLANALTTAVGLVWPW